ncbi:hypothetical protein Bca4012_062928 [Brassica carinata]|uniref:Uncharacterized protein n=1 Tax=Brassica carinata TaxID=52824 RepID=A0A8X7V8S1_BRACI|nr:hypothetical protein Bca52824_032557 [Brassica carinata]
MLHLSDVRTVLRVWVYNCLPEFAAGFGEPIEGSTTPPLLAFLGCRGKRNLKENILNQSRANNFTAKEYSEIFPRWDDDLEDERDDNIVKAMFSSGWVWEQSHWPLVGTKLWTNVKVEIHPMKTEAGQMERSKKAVSPSPTESCDSLVPWPGYGDHESRNSSLANWPDL